MLLLSWLIPGSVEQELPFVLPDCEALARSGGSPAWGQATGSHFKGVLAVWIGAGPRTSGVVERNKNRRDG
jgi:hypothetical protein